MGNKHRLLGIICGLALVAACAATGSQSVPDSTLGGGGDGGGGRGGGGHGGGGAPGAGTTASGDVIDFDSGAPGSNQGDATACSSGADEDKDGDGWSVAEGDCNDCDSNVNPGAIEVIDKEPGADGKVPPAADEDCDGIAGNVAPPCDDLLALDDVDPNSGARAIDLCQVATANPANKKEKKWGVLEAKYVRADGKTYDAPGLQVGIQSGFGPNVNVRKGKRLLELSTGHARLKDQAGVCPLFSCVTNDNGENLIHGAPQGFPQSVPNCPGVGKINDDLGLEIKLRSPTNATGYSFDFDFYSHEFPEYVCSGFNDQFISLVTPAPVGSINGNISFDKQTNPVSINIAFFDICNPQGIDNFAYACPAPNVCPKPPMPYCPSGNAELVGTSFEDMVGDESGATGWLKSQAPVKGGDEVSIRFAIWDTSDQKYDSAVLIDNFQWIASGGSVTVSTDPIVIPE